MKKLLLGCTLILSSVMIGCTGFLISALRSVQIAADSITLPVSFKYSIFNLNFFWFLIPLLLLIAGIYFVYTAAGEDE